MTFRSRLFATVALPILASSLVATPTLADALTKSFELAQQDEGGVVPDEDLLLQQQEAPQDDQRPAGASEAEAPVPPEEEPPAEASAPAAEEPQVEEAQPEEAPPAPEASDGEDRPSPDAAEQPVPEPRPETEEPPPVAEPDVPAEEPPAAADPADEPPAAAAEEPVPVPTEPEAGGEPNAPDAEQPPVEPVPQERPAAPEEAGPAGGGQGETESGEGTAGPGEAPVPVPQTGMEEPQATEAPAAEPLPAIDDARSAAEKEAIAADPSGTDETVVLPVENGAAVLDSDKDADNSGGAESRETRRKAREKLRGEEETRLPDSDAGAQADISESVREAVPQRIEAAIQEEGRRVREAPDFALPETTNIVNNTVINNTTVNNTTINNGMGAVRVRDRVDNRTVLQVGDRLIVRGDDRPRLRRDSEEVYYDDLSRDRVRETIVRAGGVRIVTVYNRYGDVIQRSRVGRDGREYVLAYFPEREGGGRRADLVDVGYELPPMRLRIPVEDYIIDTSSDPDRDYYDFLSEPPVEQVERVYSINEVKQSARLRDKVRRIDLDTITFATGSAEVPLSQARTLRSVAEAMQKILDRDPGETFLIEGHTDAVGSDASNLVLSDRRAESIADLLTDVYGIPPENLQTQGYGERFLKVRTEAAEQQNRRVTIRRVSTLIRPVAELR
ncbi:OmpA family protein [Shinella daejeonensis]|uniref:OmpA family protein n=1 Tax=Shinella daejeonensis TaxID=659017 RepID=UPI0020C80572|nr:OmpA family protein [Shinella daejeonensis]MCP8893629.1 OmpA family protein [Shinella daejeonensis]